MGAERNRFSVRLRQSLAPELTLETDVEAVKRGSALRERARSASQQTREASGTGLRFMLSRFQRQGAFEREKTEAREAFIAFSSSLILSS